MEWGETRNGSRQVKVSRPLEGLWFYHRLSEEKEGFGRSRAESALQVEGKM